MQAASRTRFWGMSGVPIRLLLLIAGLWATPTQAFSARSRRAQNRSHNCRWQPLLSFRVTGSTQHAATLSVRHAFVRIIRKVDVGLLTAASEINTDPRCRLIEGRASHGFNNSGDQPDLSGYSRVGAAHVPVPVYSFRGHPPAGWCWPAHSDPGPGSFRSAPPRGNRPFGSAGAFVGLQHSVPGPK